MKPAKVKDYSATNFSIELFSREAFRFIFLLERNILFRLALRRSEELFLNGENQTRESFGDPNGLREVIS